MVATSLGLGTLNTPDFEGFVFLFLVLLDIGVTNGSNGTESDPDRCEDVIVETKLAIFLTFLIDVDIFLEVLLLPFLNMLTPEGSQVEEIGDFGLSSDCNGSEVAALVSSSFRGPV